MGVGLTLWVESQLPPNSPLLHISTRDVRQSTIYAVASIPAIWLIIRAYWAVSGSS
jgi:hypothetical protein